MIFMTSSVFVFYLIQGNLSPPHTHTHTHTHTHAHTHTHTHAHTHGEMEAIVPLLPFHLGE